MRFLVILAVIFATPAFSQTEDYNCYDWQDPAFWQADIGDLVSNTCIADSAFVLQRDKYGWTPLHYAAEYGSVSSLLRKLTLAGADIYATTDAGQTPLDLAKDDRGLKNNVTILDILQRSEDRRLARADSTPYSSSFFDHLDQSDPEIRFSRLIALGADTEITDEDGDTILIKVLRRSEPNIALARILIEGGANVNVVGISGWTPLHWAARTLKDPEIVNLLLEYGADIEALTEGGTTALLTAARFARSYDVFAALITAGANVNFATDTGWAALHYVARYRQKSQYAVLLLESGANVNAATEKGGTALTLAAQETAGSGFFQTLLEAGGDANHQKKNGWSVLHIALEKGAGQNVVLALLDAGANINAVTSGNLTPLYVAVDYDQPPEIIQLLMQNGADPALADNAGYAPLLLAVKQQKSIQVIEALVNSGADINIMTHLGWGALNLAISGDASAETVQALLEMGANPDTANGNGNRPIQSVLRKPILNWKVLELLVNAGADLDFRYAETGAPLLHSLTGHNQRGRLFGLFLDAGANPNLVDRDGDTVLSKIAVTGIGAELIPILVANGANPNQPKPPFLGNAYFRGFSPLHIAILFSDVQLRQGSRSDLSLINTLLENGADPNQTIKNQTTAMHFAAQYAKDPEIIALLVAAGGDVNASTNEGMTPLHLAAFYDGDAAVIQVFVDYGANLEARLTGMETTPLQLAVNRSAPKTVAGFIDAGANLDVLGSNGETLLDFAVQNEKLNGSDVLLLLDGQPL